MEIPRLVSVEVAKVCEAPVKPPREVMAEDNLLLKVVQSAAVSNPRFTAEADGRLKVQVLVEEEIVKSVPVVELAKVMAD